MIYLPVILQSPNQVSILVKKLMKVMSRACLVCQRLTVVVTEQTRVLSMPLLPQVISLVSPRASLRPAIC